MNTNVSVSQTKSGIQSRKFALVNQTKYGIIMNTNVSVNQT